MIDMDVVGIGDELDPAPVRRGRVTDDEMADSEYCSTCSMGNSCSCCLNDEDYVPWPCPDLRDIAIGLGIDPGLDTEETNVSSTFNLICLSHDPALVVDVDWQSGADGRLVAEGQLRDPAASQHERVREHARCDLVIGRYSCPLVEVGYLPRGFNRVQWVDADWVRPLASMASCPDGLRLPHGWTWDRARRLRSELGLDTEPVQYATGGPVTGPLVVTGEYGCHVPAGRTHTGQ